MEACVIVTYRCNAKCYMCNTWKHPSRESEEFSPGLIEKFPSGLKFMNVTGGEPFMREDLGDIIGIALKKTKRLVISSNGFFTDRIVELAEEFGNQIGFRISIEGLPAVNDALRGIKDGFDGGIRSLTRLHAMGIEDIGFGITVSDANAQDMIELYRLADAMDVEFATAVTHNSYYFHKQDNEFENPEMIAAEFEKIAFELLKANRPKNWFRAYFNMGLANRVRGGNRPLPCEVGMHMFFLDPYGNILPCNGSDEPMIMGNLREQSFEEIWNSQRADEIREKIKSCPKQCWMIGSVSPAMKKRVWVPAKWVLRNKIKILFNHNKTLCLDPVNKQRS